MAENPHETTLATLSYLEARLMRIEHVFYGHTAPITGSIKCKSAVDDLEELETRFANILNTTRTYAELLKISDQHPDLFQSSTTAGASESTLPIETRRAVVLAAASSFPATASALTSIIDTPIPEPALSATLVSLKPRMRAIEAAQLVQAADIAELRARSEVLIRAWYESGVMDYSNFIADVETRVRAVENGTRRVEKARQDV